MMPTAVVHKLNMKLIQWALILFYFLCCAFHPLYYLLPSILSPSRNSDPGSHSRFFSPQRFVACTFTTKIFQLFIPSSTRVELCLPTLGVLSMFFFLQICSKSYHDGIRTPGSTLVAFEGYH